MNFSDERSERIAGLLASFCFGSRSRVLTFQLAGRSDGGSARLTPLELFLNKLLHASLGEAGSVFFFPHLDRAPRELLTPLRELARSGVFADETRQGAEAGMIDARHALILGSVTLDGTGGGDLSAEELLEASLPGEMVREFIHLFASV
ncbi:MAG: hypothetical protein HY536_00210 [Candidatus Colwellbacteria bacterium]|nr:hypothetical protein [Candidatus Colwellbacteria bacterium]